VALEAVVCATQLDGLVIVEVKGILATRDVHMFGMSSQWAKNLHTWGEARVVTTGK